MNALASVVSLAAAGLLAACASAGTPGANRPLDGTDWRLVELTGSPVAPGAASSEEPFLRFDADSGRVTGNTGCNLLSGPFTRDGATLSFGALITTKRACVDESRNQRERDFLAALERTRTHAVQRDTLVLSGDGGGVLARLAAQREP